MSTHLVSTHLVSTHLVSTHLVIDTPQILETAAQPTAVIRLTIPRADIRAVMGPGLTKLRAAVAAQGVAPNGPWFTHHLRVDPDVFDFEIGVPVDAPVEAADGVQPSEWPAQRAARTVYRGDYAGLGAAWGEFNAWIAAAGHTVAPDFWERYLTGPESGEAADGWRTEFTRPLLAVTAAAGAERG